MMNDYWITTHWPTPTTEPGMSRHVYVKERRDKVPNPGDFIFFRESISATVNGRRVRTATRLHRGHQAQFDLPRGSGGIIGTATVDDGARRPISNEDVVFDYGDAPRSTWFIIPCRDFQVASLPLEELLTLLDKNNPRFLSLWQIPDHVLGSKLIKELRR